MTPAPPRIVVIGTAGHVDHGKSALVQALTGTHPDRLAEERARGLTIDLGFAWCALPSGTLASFVDVPGHEDFIRNMLAGVGGVDAALLVIAADEGPMPQTYEHLAILDLLGVAAGVVALTKIDKVEPDWLALVAAEVRRLLAGTSLARVPIVPVSAQTGDGLDSLVAALDTALADAPGALDRGRARLAVDRAFTLAGFGTVVTGTLRDGALRPGDALEVLPSGLKTRARSLQTHGRSVTEARPGTRTAINLAGIGTEDVRRGDVVAPPGLYHTSQLLDVRLEMLPEAGAPGARRGHGRVASVAAIGSPYGPLRHDAQVHLFHGAAEIPTQVRVIGGREIPAGGVGYAQLRLAHPGVFVAGDRFVIRQPSPSHTIGGGVVLDPNPPGRRRRFRPPTLAHFQQLAEGDAADRIGAHLAELGPCRADALTEQDTGLNAADRNAALAILAADGRALRLGPFWIGAAAWPTLQTRLVALLESYHQRFPLRPGPPGEEVRTRLNVSSEVFGAVVTRAVAEGWLSAAGETLHLPGHQVSFKAETQSAIDAVLERFRAAPFSPPAEHETVELLGRPVVAALIRQGDLVGVGGDVLFTPEAYTELKAGVLDHIASHGQITVADVRDRFQTSRKYALALLEHFDKVRLTRRVGDARVAAKPGEAR